MILPQVNFMFSFISLSECRKENTNNLKHKIENFDLRFQKESFNIVDGLRFRVADVMQAVT